MFEFNKDDKRRCEIMGISNTHGYRLGGIFHFGNLTLEQLDKLLEEKFIDPKEAQNNSPTVDDFRFYMKRFSGATAHGYIISPERDDYRVSIEGIECEGDFDVETQIDFYKTFRFADELICNDNYMYCWFD